MVFRKLCHVLHCVDFPTRKAQDFLTRQLFDTFVRHVVTLISLLFKYNFALHFIVWVEYLLQENYLDLRIVVYLVLLNLGKGSGFWEKCRSTQIVFFLIWLIYFSSVFSVNHTVRAYSVDSHLFLSSWLQDYIIL